jgi:rubrerythrin
MSVLVEEQVPIHAASVRNHIVVRYILAIVATSYVIVSLYFIFDTRSRLDSLAANNSAAITSLQQRETATEANVKTSNQARSQQMGMTQRELQAAYAGTKAELRQNQNSFERRMQEQQNAAVDQVTVVAADVRSELNGAKKDIADTRADLESTKIKLDRAVGDLNGQSSLIARTREDLEELRHRGDHDYYEFTLYKGQQPTRLSTVALQLKKADAKKSKFTLNVMADDRVIEKKDRGAGEPLQFYTGRNRALYEVVIFTVEKNKVTGYLSTPKSTSVAFGN